MSTHPFLDRSFYIPWSQLNPDAIEPDISDALEDAQDKINAIAGQEPAKVTFASTFLALEEATEGLGRAWGMVGHLSSVEDSKPLREAHNKMLPKISEFYSRVPLNAELWSVLKAFAEKQDEVDQLTPVDRRLFDETMADFRQHGADLPADKKKRLEAVQSELAQLTQKYSENVLDSTNAWELVIEDEDKLKGLPETALEAARRNAEAKGKGSAEKPAYRFTLHAPSMIPFMTYLEDGDLRRQMWEAATAIGAREPYDNTDLIRRILKLRQERAELLGRPHFPDLVLERRMAKNGQKALDFVDDLHDRVEEAFRRECDELEDFRAKEIGDGKRALQPWEIGFWSEKLRRARYDFDEEALRPYFPMNRVIDGLFEIAQRVFNVSIEEASHAGEVWDPSVKIYEMKDAATGVLLGSFYTDWYPRESKRSGAWMNFLITGGPQANGDRLPHLGLICGNMTEPAGDRPALLDHREVETVFHEFGHLVHHLFGEVPVKSLNGVNVAWDFVELPSQIMENWTWEREALDLFACHWKTGETIPQDLFDKMIAAKNFRAACFTMRQLSLGKMDLEMHLHPERFVDSDLETALRELLADYLIPTHTPAPSLVRRFGHLFSDPVGYAAGYYSYKWAEVLDADAFTRFKQEGIFNPAVGMAFRENILSKGNSEDPMVLYKRFMGREPDLTALLERSGLANAG